MKTAKFVTEVSVKDPDYPSLYVEVSIYKHENGGMFGLDSAWLDQCTDDDSNPVIRDPFETKGKVMLIEDDAVTDYITDVDLPQ